MERFGTVEAGDEHNQDAAVTGCRRARRVLAPLGAKGANYTLVWGGWWFWDPVENASFMPWIAGTTLLHSALVVERRNALVSWTILLAILTFSLSLIGTFLVRSGVLTSVHAFALDPARGVFILGLILIATGGALTLYAFRVPRFKYGALFALVSRESGLVANNVLLSAAAATVFLGTFYPLIVDMIGDDKISVGPPYYNRTFVPIMVPLLLRMVVGPMLKWKRDNIRAAVGRLKHAAPCEPACSNLGVDCHVWPQCLCGGVHGGGRLAGRRIACGFRISHAAGQRAAGNHVEACPHHAAGILRACDRPRRDGDNGRWDHRHDELGHRKDRNAPTRPEPRTVGIQSALAFSGRGAGS
jgi:Cytochrome c-type biogenesis protein CcmF C-terminal/Cytochrome C assembly protein